MRSISCGLNGCWCVCVDLARVISLGDGRLVSSYVSSWCGVCLCVVRINRGCVSDS